MEACDSYKGIAAVSEGLYKDKGSRFLSYAYPVSSEEEVKPLVDALKKEHHAARHHCFAYRIGPFQSSRFRANDDGEPAGTAGRPILGAIDSAGLSDVLVVVVRYFGGILLGVPGLINAYREAAAAALSGADVVEIVPRKHYSLEFGYEEMNEVQRILKASPGVETVKRDFDSTCTMEVAIRLSAEQEFIEKLNQTNNERGTHIQCRAL